MNKKYIIITLLIFLILIIGAVLFIKQKLAPVNDENTQALPTPTVALPTVSDKTKVDLTATQNKQSVVLKITGIDSDVDSIEYELTYTTGAGIPRGVLGKIKISGEKEITRSDIVLGTCSSGKCVYDTGVSQVDLSLKFNTPSGSSIFQKSYTL